jgi:hypothetical protein
VIPAHHVFQATHLRAGKWSESLSVAVLISVTVSSRASKHSHTCLLQVLNSTMYSYASA